MCSMQGGCGRVHHPSHLQYLVIMGAILVGRNFPAQDRSINNGGNVTYRQGTPALFMCRYISNDHQARL